MVCYTKLLHKNYYQTFKSFLDQISSANPVDSSVLDKALTFEENLVQLRQQNSIEAKVSQKSQTHPEDFYSEVRSHGFLVILLGVPIPFLSIICLYLNTLKDYYISETNEALLFDKKLGV